MCAIPGNYIQNSLTSRHCSGKQEHPGMDENNNFESFLEDLLNKDESSDTERLTGATTTAGEVLEKKSETGRRNPFKFLDAYTSADHDIFFGRDMEIKELYHSVFSHKVTVVFGNSGVVKRRWSIAD